MNPHPPPLAGLRTFAVAARLLSFKLAASALHVTPGAVSQQIKLLEAQLGAPLFLRLTRSLALTERGAAMLPLVQEGLDVLDRAWRLAQAQTAPRPVRLAAPPAFASHWLVPRLADFNAEHPDIVLQLSSSSSTVAHAHDPASRSTRSRERGDPPADLIIVFSAEAPPAGAGTVDLLLAPRYTAVCAPALADALREPAGLLHQRLIHDDTVHAAGQSGLGAWGWPQWLAAQGLALPGGAPGLRVSNTVLAIEAAVAGQGVALAARELVARQLAAATLVAPLAMALAGPYHYHLVCRPVRVDGADAQTTAAVRGWLMAQAASPSAPGAVPLQAG